MIPPVMQMFGMFDAASAPVETGTVAAGRKRRYFVEINGRHYWAESPSHAQAILERAAEQLAKVDTDKVVARARRIGRVALSPPVIHTNAPIAVEPIIERINDGYAEAMRIAEIRYLLEMQDEEDAAFLLL